MPSNYGFLGDIAGGLREGLIGYQTMKTAQDNMKRKDLLEGIQSDDTGIHFTPEKQQQIEESRQLAAKRNAFELAQYDPTSDLSKRNTEAYKNAGLILPEGSSMAEASSYAKPQEFQQNLEMKKLLAQQHNDNVRAQAGERKAASTSKDQDKAYQDARNDSEKFRGNTAVQQASEGIVNAKKALDILKNYPNPNDMPPQMVNTLTMEMAKIAGGGAAHEGAMHALVPNGSGMTFADLIQKISNAPHGAQQGAIIKDNARYLNSLLDTNQEAVDQYRANINKAHWRKMSDEQKAEYLQDYPGTDKFFNPQKKSETTGGGLLGSSSSGPKKGDVEGGYEFLGGNPSDKTNWRKQ